MSEFEIPILHDKHGPRVAGSADMFDYRGKIESLSQQLTTVEGSFKTAIEPELEKLRNDMVALEGRINESALSELDNFKRSLAELEKKITSVDNDRLFSIFSTKLDPRFNEVDNKTRRNALKIINLERATGTFAQIRNTDRGLWYLDAKEVSFGQIVDPVQVAFVEYTPELFVNLIYKNPQKNYYRISRIRNVGKYVGLTINFGGTASSFDEVCEAIADAPSEFWSAIDGVALVNLGGAYQNPLVETVSALAKTYSTKLWVFEQGYLTPSVDSLLFFNQDYWRIDEGMLDREYSALQGDPAGRFAIIHDVNSIERAIITLRKLSILGVTRTYLYSTKKDGSYRYTDKDVLALAHAWTKGDLLFDYFVEKNYPQYKNLQPPAYDPNP